MSGRSSSPSKPIYKPSQVLRKVKAGTIADPQPKGEARIVCEPHGHPIAAETESPTFWENGTYIGCKGCGSKWVIPRIEFRDFIIDLTGERKKYPLTLT